MPRTDLYLVRSPHLNRELARKAVAAYREARRKVRSISDISSQPDSIQTSDQKSKARFKSNWPAIVVKIKPAG